MSDKPKVLFKVTVNINNRRINSRMDEFVSKLLPLVKQQIYKGSYPFTPYLGGDLCDSAQASAQDSTPYLIYNIVYAKYQYYADGRAPEDFPGRTKNTHPNASCLWVDKDLSAGGREEINRLIKDAPQILRF